MSILPRYQYYLNLGNHHVTGIFPASTSRPSESGWIINHRPDNEPWYSTRRMIVLIGDVCHIEYS